MNWFAYTWITILSSLLVWGCTDTDFGGGSQTRKAKKPSGTDVSDSDLINDNDTDDGKIDTGDNGNDDTSDFDLGTENDEDESDDDPIRTFDDEAAAFLLVNPVEPEQKSHIWVVTTAGNAYYMRVEDDAVVSRKQWTGITGGGGGARTYVTEGGVVIAKTGGHMYWIDPESTPEGAIGKSEPNYFKLNGPAGDDRVCVVSYRRDKKRYLGMGFGNGKFVEIKMKNKAPFEPEWDDQTGTASANGGSRWGYSCYIDQKRLIYYGAWHNTAVQAVDIEDMDGTSPTKAPNGGFTSNNLADETVGPKGIGSYALSGDRDGNVLNGKSYYTFAYEPKSKTVWGTGRSGNTLNVFPAKCFYDDKNCSDHAGFNMSQLGIQARPLSALGNGKMIGLSRGGNGSVYIMELKDKDDISKGVDATRIAEVQGDPYMYTDFTGATLYLTRSEMTFELDEADEFNRKKETRGIGFAWSPVESKNDEWKDIKLRVRCYDDEDDRGEYETVKKVKDAKLQTIILVDSCKEKKYDKVDVLLIQEDDEDTLMNVRKVQITAYQ